MTNKKAHNGGTCPKCQEWRDAKDWYPTLYRRCKPCELERRREYNAKKRDEMHQFEEIKFWAPTPPQNENPLPDGSLRTAVVNSCGHTYYYNIKRAGAQNWLKSQPCPNCRAGRSPKYSETVPLPEPEPVSLHEPETEPKPKPQPRKADKVWVDGIMDLLPTGRPFHQILPDLIMVLKAGLPVWLQGPPGTSKSTLAQQAAVGLRLGLYPVSCHELMTRSDLFGFTDAAGRDHRTPLWDAYEDGGVLLLDEVDNGNPNLIAAMNSALSNGHCVFGSGTIVQRHDNFRVVATANTAGLGPEHGFIGRNGVDLATRDRFITLDVPVDDDLEVALAEIYSGGEIELLAPEFTAAARRRLSKRSITHEDVSSAQVVDVVRKLRALVSTRFHGMVVSPRTTIHVAAMTTAGFTLKESLVAKLPGLKPEEAYEIISTAEVL